MANVALAILWLCAILGASNAVYTPILSTRFLGQLMGVQEFSEDGVPYYSFKGIRYAEPPIGELRFREPREAAPVPENSLVDATRFGPSCVQVDRNPPTLEGCEDCLRVNVYMPARSHGQLLPVLVYNDGGAYIYGNGTSSPRRVVSRGIVVVTVQYRVGILGFLSSGDRDLPGNYGLFDQQLALKWVRKNIHEFGGDCNRVTLAGTASPTLHMVSPGSLGLFQQAIATSGSFLNPWILHFGDQDKVRAVARYVGCPCSAHTPISELLPCLRSASPYKLAEAQLLFQGWHENPFAPIGPVVDHHFLPDDPYKLLLQGRVARVPLLLSYTTAEGLYVVAEFMENDHALAELDRNWNEIAPLLLDYVDTAPTKRERDYTSNAIRSKYLGHAPISKLTLPQLIQLEGDRFVVSGIDQFAKTLASLKGSGPIYMYEYGYRGEFSVSQAWSKSPINRGPSHEDDVNFVFPDVYAIPPPRTHADKNMACSLVDIWEAFIKTGVPTTANFPVWSPVPPTGDRLTVLKIASYNKGSLVTVPEIGCSSFWRSLPLLESGTPNGHPTHSPAQIHRVPAFLPEQYHRRFATPIRLCQPLDMSGWQYFPATY